MLNNFRFWNRIGRLNFKNYIVVFNLIHSYILYLYKINNYILPRADIDVVIAPPHVSATAYCSASFAVRNDFSAFMNTHRRRRYAKTLRTNHKARVRYFEPPVFIIAHCDQHTTIAFDTIPSWSYDDRVIGLWISIVLKLSWTSNNSTNYCSTIVIPNNNDHSNSRNTRQNYASRRFCAYWHIGRKVCLWEKDKRAGERSSVVNGGVFMKLNYWHDKSRSDVGNNISMVIISRSLFR